MNLTDKNLEFPILATAIVFDSQKQKDISHCILLDHRTTEENQDYFYATDTKKDNWTSHFNGLIPVSSVCHTIQESRQQPDALFILRKWIILLLIIFSS